MEVYTSTRFAVSEKLKNGKSFVLLMALICTSLLGNAGFCGSNWMDMVESSELLAEEGASSIQSSADQGRNSTKLMHCGRFQVIMQLIRNSEKCWFPTVNKSYLEWLSLLGFAKPVLNWDIPNVFWSGLKKTYLVAVFIMILLAICAVHSQLADNRRTSNMSISKFMGASNLNGKLQVLPSSSSGASGLSRTLEEQEAIKIESLCISPSNNIILKETGLLMASSGELALTNEEPKQGSSSSKLDTDGGKEKCRRKRRRRRSSGSSNQRGNSTHSSSPLPSPVIASVPTVDLTFETGIKPKTVRNEKKPEEKRIVNDNNPVVLFPSANDLCILISTSTIALHARAPGPKHQNKELRKETTAIINDQYKYDIWADHLCGAAESEIWNSFFVMGPEPVNCPHKGD